MLAAEEEARLSKLIKLIAKTKAHKLVKDEHDKLLRKWKLELASGTDFLMIQIFPSSRLAMKPKLLI